MPTDIPACHPSQSRRGSRPLRRTSTCRSCRYHSPPIPPPLQHSGQVYMIFLFLEEGDRFPNPQNIHTALHTRLFFSASAPTRPQLSSARSFLPPHRQLSSAGSSCHTRSCHLHVTPIHCPDSYFLPVFPFHSTY